MTEPTRRRLRKRYKDEFKREAGVELFQQSDVSAAQLSTELGVATNRLYRWSREFAIHLRGDLTP